jgi:hypothetical protein
VTSTPTPVDLDVRVARLEQSVRTLVWWLVQAQTGFGEGDARGIEDILDGAPGIHASAQQERN